MSRMLAENGTEPKKRLTRRKKENPSTTRKGWEYYGISPERYAELSKGCREGLYSRETMLKACTGFEWIADFIILSVVSGRGFDSIDLMELGRCPVGRSNFYGFRRKFYGNLNLIIQNNREQSETF